MTSTIAPRFQKRPDPEVFVGEVKVSIVLENFVDTADAARGRLSIDQVRRETVEMVVDTGVSDLVLPEDLVERLGLEQLGTAEVTYADGRTETRPLAGMVVVNAAGRQARVDCDVAQPGTTPLLGQVPLEILDLLVDCRHQRLVPHPESPYMTRRFIR